MSAVLHTATTGSGPTIVLVHGFMADWTYWKKLSAILADNYTVVMVDLLGFGDSPKPRDKAAYSFENQVTLLHNTLEKLNAKTPFILVGHSMGALVAATYAVRYPHNISQLILSNMSIFLDREETREKLAATGILYRTLLYKPYARVLWPILKKSLPVLRMRYGELRNMTQKHSHASRKGALHALEHTNVKILLERLQVPTDLIIGLRDRPMYQKNITKIRLPENITLHYVQTGHHTPVHKPELLVQLLH